MLVVDVLLLIGGAIVVMGASTAIASIIDKKLKISREKREDEKKGKHNAELIRLKSHTCLSCQGNVNPEVDVFDHGFWWHKECWEKTLNGKE